MIADHSPIMEYTPRTGTALRRYKRRLRGMASEVCPPDKSWQVLLLAAAEIAFFIGAFVAWGHGLV